jgi:hypothetical protein
LKKPKCTKSIWKDLPIALVALSPLFLQLGQAVQAIKKLSLVEDSVPEVIAFVGRSLDLFSKIVSACNEMSKNLPPKSDIERRATQCLEYSGDVAAKCVSDASALVQAQVVSTTKTLTDLMDDASPDGFAKTFTTMLDSVAELPGTPSQKTKLLEHVDSQHTGTLYHACKAYDDLMAQVPAKFKDSAP